MNNAPTVREVQTAKGHLYVEDHAGDGPVFVMTHGYPDDSRIYQRIVPELAPRRVVTFDFLGHGRSGREATWPLEPGQRESELAAVIDSLGLDKPILVGHDSSGPVVTNYAVANPGRTGGPVLLNTYYTDSATADRHEIAGASHWPQWDQPAATAAIAAAATADV